jgi:hypothetical protein
MEKNEESSKKLPCEHYEYEYKLNCNVYGRFKRFLKADDSNSFYTCDQLKEYFISCVKYRDDPLRNLDCYIKLQPYENNLLTKRINSVKQNSILKLRNHNPPIDWNAPLPNWY